MADGQTAVLCHNCGNERGFPGTHPVVAFAKKKREWTLCDDCYENSVIISRPNLYEGADFAWYTPQLFQRHYHACTTPNHLLLGTRGTGKSTVMRRDAIIRCMKFSGFKVLILRRKIPDLRKSHLRFINQEMKQLGDEVGYYRETTTDVVFKNGSFIQFSHCETLKDIENYLGSEWDLIIFDEISTFTLDMFLTICAAARSGEDDDYSALVRCGSNPAGVGAMWMKAWFVDKEVNVAEYPDYNPDDFSYEFSTLKQNIYLGKDYERRLRNVPGSIRKAWLLGQFVVEGAYFEDFVKAKEVDWHGEMVVRPWHCIQMMPVVHDKRTGRTVYAHQVPWMNIYRSVDWGWDPDPAVCHWHLVLANKRKITFLELTKTKTIAADFAKLIVEMSSGMHVVETSCDPQMFVKRGEAKFSIGELFEMNGVPLEPAQNSRELYGYVLHDMLNTIVYEPIEDGSVVDYPSWQIYEPGCPKLVGTLPLLQLDTTDPRKIANGPDHWAVSCAYFGMCNPVPGVEPRPSQRRQERRHGVVT